MATRIYLFDGTLLTTVADGNLDTTVSPLAIPGKGYQNYGEPVMQDILWTMTNFAGGTPPAPPMEGMCWYDRTNGQLKVWKDTYWSALFLDSKTNLPRATNSFDLGSAAYQFNNIYANTMHANHFVGDPTIWRTFQTNLPDTTLTYDIGSAVLRMRTVYAQTFDGTAAQARYADLAERYATSDAVEPGDLVSIGGDAEIRLTAGADDVDYFGVISTNPGYMMNSDAGDDATHPYVALVGRVPCKVVGSVAKGDRLTLSSTPGVATKMPRDGGHYTLVGRALANKESEELGFVEIVVGR